jgi:hypothetical protein
LRFDDAPGPIAAMPNARDQVAEFVAQTNPLRDYGFSFAAIEISRQGSRLKRPNFDFITGGERRLALVECGSFFNNRKMKEWIDFSLAGL